MGHLQGNFTPVLCIGRKVPKGQEWDATQTKVKELLLTSGS